MKFEPTVHTLSNGITVILDPMDIETVAIKIRFLTGARDETPENQGITHFCEHMLCKGTPTLPSNKTIKDFLENRGGTFNASTSQSKLHLFGRIIAENTFDLLNVFADQLQNSLFDEKRIEIERGVILDESRRAHGSNSRKHEDFMENNLLGFSAFRVLGPDKNIESFTRNQLLDWMKQRLSAKNCTICVSGRIDDKDALLKKIENLFNFLPTHDVQTNHFIKYNPCDKFLHEASIKNVWTDIVFPFLRPDTYENFRVNLAESKFHKYLIQSLNETLRQNNGLVYSIGMGMYGNETDGVNSIHTETSAENLGRAVALIAQTAYRVYNVDKITQSDIVRFHNIHKLADADFLESATRRCDVLLSHWTDFGKLYDFKAVVEMDGNITADEVIAASNGFFNGPMSVMSFGAEHNCDLKQIWNDNFK